MDENNTNQYSSQMNSSEGETPIYKNETNNSIKVQSENTITNNTNNAQENNETKESEYQNNSGQASPSVIQNSSNTQNPNIGNYSSPTTQSNIAQSKNKKNTYIITLIILAVILLGVFVIYPFIRDNFFNTPERIFKKSIDNVATLLKNNLNKYNLDNSLYDVNLKINSNMDEISQFNNYTFGMLIGGDKKNNAFETKMYMLEGTKEYSYAVYLKNSKLYQKLSTYDKLITLDDDSSESFKELFEALGKANNDDTKYLVNKIASLLKDNMDKNKFAKSNAKLDINGKEIKVQKNTYTIDNKEYTKLSKAILNGLYNDAKSMEIITNSYDIDKNELKEMIDQITEDSSADTLLVNIYTKGGTFAGIDFTENSITYISYYTDNTNFNFSINSGLSDFSIKGVKDQKQTNVNIESGGVQIATLNVRKFEEKEVDLDYQLSSELGINVNGTLTYKQEQEKDSINGKINFSVITEGQKINLQMNINEKKNAKISDIDEKTAVKLSNEELEKVMNDFIKSLENTPLGFLTSYGLSNTQNIDNLY